MILATSVRLILAGYDYRHDEAFVIDRPQGTPDFLFLHFTTAVSLLDAGGVRQHAAGTCILYAPGHRQWYRGAASGLSNDWCHALGLGPIAKRAGLALNRAFTLSPRRPVAPLLYALEREQLAREPLHEDVARALLVQLVATAARSSAEARGMAGARLGAIRASVHSDLTRDWDVAAMARRAGLSPSRFSALYRATFARSPLSDLLDARIERARWWLTNSDLPLRIVAERCGFADEYYFNRCFSRRVGVPPSRYRKRPRPFTEAAR